MLKLLRHPRAIDGFVALLAAVGVYLFAGEVDAHYPIKHWLFWRYALCWLVAIGWGACLLSAGHAILLYFRRRLLPVREQLVMSFAVGVLAFFLASFVGGLLGLLGPIFFFVLPLALGGAGARPSFRYLRRLRRHLLAARRRVSLRTPLWLLPLVGFGLISLLAVYLPLLLPENVSYDSRWYHMAIGEQYATVGRVFRFSEGWLLGTYPHLSSHVYAWAFQMPNVTLFERVVLAQHLEFLLFLATLASIPALVRSVLRVRAPHSWVALFLFPGILIYDSSLNGGADHIAALWAVPMYLALLRVWRETNPVNAGLFAAMVAGPLNCKYSAVAIVAGPLLAFGVLLLIRAVPRRRNGTWSRPWPVLVVAASALGVALALTAPHWLKNWIWYGDPVYPLLQGKLDTQPWSAEATRNFAAVQSSAWRAARDWEGLKESFKVLYTFSFVPHNWEHMHGKVPVFGSLFTLFALLLLAVRRRAVWGLFVTTNVCVFVWFWVQHEDRYLQGLVPLMAGAVAAVVVHLWRSRGVIARVGVAALLVFQVAWGGDVFFFPAHQMLGGSPLKALVDHVSAGYRKDYLSRLRPFAAFQDIRKQLDRKSVLLIHEDHIQLGIGVRTIQDSPGFQGGLYYTEQKSPAALNRKLRGLGATHVLWRSSSLQSSSVAEDLVFYDFVHRRTVETTQVSGYNLSRLPERVDDERPFGDIVAFYGCRDSDRFAYEPGLYHLRQLSIMWLEKHPTVPTPFAPASRLDPDQVQQADFVVINPSCHEKKVARLERDFLPIGSLKQLRFWVRRTSP